MEKLKRRFFTKAEQEFLIKNYDSLNSVEIAVKLNRSVQTILTWACRLKLTCTHRLIYEEEAIVNDFKNNGLTFVAIQRKYRHGWKRLKPIFKKHNLKIWGRGKTRKCFIDDNFFEKIDTENKAYWLGFLYADGNVYGNSLQIGLAQKDREHLELFTRTLCSTHKICNDRNGPKFSVRSDKIVADLFKLGIKPQKTFQLKFPNEQQVPKYLVRHFIRGFFDGDGTIVLYKGYTRKDKSRENRWLFSIIGVELMLEPIQAYFKQAGLPTRKLIVEKRSGNGRLFYLKYGGTNNTSLQILYNFLYQDATVFLKRKKEKFNGKLTQR